jgi:3',5'-cyclic AMP phosphodiesterase CpdA
MTTATLAATHAGDPAPDASRAMNEPIRLLHLSDIHFRADKTWDSDPVLRALAVYIRREVGEGLTPDLVVITGDLAHAGKAEEYQLAREWLDRELWPVLTADRAEPLPRGRLLLVPGNHDVDARRWTSSPRRSRADC